MAKQITKTPPRDITWIKNQIVTLRARERELAAKKIEIELTGDEGKQPVAFDVDQLAQQIARGETPSAPGPKPASPLFLLNREREAITKAIDILQNELIGAVEQRAQRELERRGDEWRANLRATAVAICQLQKLNRARDAMAKEIRKGGSRLAIPGETPAHKIGGLGFAHVITDCDKFLELVLRLGIVTPGEIEHERGDTKELYAA